MIGRLLTLALLIAAVQTTQAALPDDGQTILREWQVGKSVSPEAVARFGIDNCFTDCEIDDALFARMDGKSYKKECTVPRSELCYLRMLHYTLDGKIRLGELVCNKAIRQDLLEIFRALYQAKYPIERMVLIDNYDAQDGPSMLANNSSAFNFRFVAGSSRLSNHSRGMAVDINPRYNPYVKISSGRTIVDPPEAAPYVDRTKRFNYKIDRDDLAYKLFKKYGFTWGGDWKSMKDYQHFEKAK